MEIKLQNTAAAFLIRDGHYLMIKRSLNKKIAPGVWSAIGGKFEQHLMSAECKQGFYEKLVFRASKRKLWCWNG